MNDLINYFPIDYIDLSNFSTIASSKIGFVYTISSTVYKVEKKTPKPDVKLVEITVTDSTGTMIITSFNQLWLADSLKKDDKLAVSGTIEFNYGFKRMTNPYIYQLNSKQDVKEFAKIVPVYKHSDKISSQRICTIVKSGFDYLKNFDSYIPEKYTSKYRLMDYFDALYQVHFPNTKDDLDQAIRTLKYIQVYTQQSVIYKNLIVGSKRNINLLHFDFPTDKINKIAQAVALYKDMGSQIFILCNEDIVFLQYKKALINEFQKFKVNAGFVNRYTSKEINWKYLYDYKNGDLDVLICADINLLNKIEPKSLSLIIVDEKQNFNVSAINKLLNISPDADVLYTSCMPLTDNLSTLLYPDAIKEEISSEYFSCCNVQVIKKELYMSAYEQAVEFAQAGNQVIVYVPDVDFIVKRASEQIFNGWNVDLISKNTNNKQALSILNKFEEGKIDVLVFSRFQNVTVKSAKPVFVVVEDANKIGLTKLHQLRNSVCHNGFDNQMTLVCSYDSKWAFNRLLLLKDNVDGNSLITKDLMGLKIGTDIGFKNFGFGFLKLIDFVKDTAVIDTACQDVKDSLDQENKILSFYISRFMKVK